MSAQAQVGLLLALAFVVVCWVLVLGHQLGWGILGQPNGNEFVESAIMLAYVISGISICAVVTAFVASLRKEKQEQ